jgi:hypothetical protein
MLKSKKIVKNLLILYVAVSFAFLGCGKGNVSTGVKMIDDLIGIKKSDKNIQVMLALWQQSQNQYNGTGTVSADTIPIGEGRYNESYIWIINDVYFRLKDLNLQYEVLSPYNYRIQDIRNKQSTCY